MALFSFKTNSIMTIRDKNFGNFDRFFAEISFFGAGGKEIQVEKAFEKKSWKNREKSEKSDFFPKKSDFSRNFG